MRPSIRASTRHNKYMKNLLKIIFIIFILVAIGYFAYTQNTIRDISKSHIEANEPKQELADGYLKRDLTLYFSQKYNTEVNVSYEMLRNSATQSGVAYPKYYIWVIVNSKDMKTLLISGTARVAAVEQSKFEVTDFVSIEDIKKDPEQLKQIFPAAIIPKIQERASQ